MTRLRLFVVAGCVVISGCQTPTAARPTGDMQHWVTHKVQGNNRIVRFTIPPGESWDYPSFAIPQKIDLDGSDSFDEARSSSRLLRRSWDYRQSRFVAVDSSLDAFIAVSKSDRDLQDLSALGAWLKGESQREADAAVQGGKPGLANPVLRLTSKNIRGREWLRVDYRISGSNYVTPFDHRHYLVVRISSGGSMRADWNADAKAAGDAILNSVAIE